MIGRCWWLGFVGVLLFTGVAVSTEGVSYSEYKENKKGVKAFKRGEISKALALFKEMLSRSDDEQGFSQTHYNLGNVYYAEQVYDKAKESYQSALNQSDGGDDTLLKAAAYYNLGNTAFQQENYDEAIQFYRESLSLVPEDDASKYNLEVALAKKRAQQQKSVAGGGQQNPNNDPEKNDEPDNQPNQDPDPEKNPNNGPSNTPPNQDDDRKKKANQVLKLLDQKEKEVKQRYREPIDDLKPRPGKDW